MQTKTRRRAIGGSGAKTAKVKAKAEQNITDADVDAALLMEPIPDELFHDDQEKYTGYRMKMIPNKPDVYELSNYGKYYPMKRGAGFRVETAETPTLFVHEGYVYKKQPSQPAKGNLKYDRRILPNLAEEKIEAEIEDDLAGLQDLQKEAEIEDLQGLQEEKIEDLKGLQDAPIENIPIDDKIEDDLQEFKDAENEDLQGLKDAPIEEQPISENEETEYEYRKEHPQNQISIDINGKTITQDDDFLYPSLNDPYLNVKIANRTEFASYKYDGTPDDIKTRSDNVCRNQEFELLPHQLFVKNFLSKNTPYRSILLYHGLGSGKTCSAIGIAEEMRLSMKQSGVANKILIIASTNVQDNFRLQLFDERKLKRSGTSPASGAWTMESCIGNSLLREINPTNDVNITAEKIASQANAIINNSYAFTGYLQMANYVQRRALIPDDPNNKNAYTKKQKDSIEINNIKRLFNNRLIIIDEVHNVPNSMVAPLLMLIAKHAENVRFVLLSATPMYNSVEEIIWIANLMNMNDGRTTIKVGDVFDKKGLMVDGQSKGKDLLRRKLNGYVSYVRGENPYTFPFRLYPDIFSVDNTFENNPYPTKTITGGDELPVMQGMKNRIFLTQIGREQERAYQFIVTGAGIFKKSARSNIFRSAEEDDDVAIYENMESYGYTKLQVPLQSLIMTFPSPALDALGDASNTSDVHPDTAKEIIEELVGKTGIAKAMSFKEERKQVDEETFIYMKHKYEYKKGYEGLFALPRLKAHSSKIAHICEMITDKRSTGIVMVYTQYIDGGIVPMALALEELGFARYGSNQQFVKPLFKKGAASNQEPRDAKTMELRADYAKSKDLADFKQAKYLILSGDKYFSQNNAKDIKYATSKSNMDGEDVRVILISRAASEGLDFKFIRQVHVLDPWYNLNRIEQIVGRGVRNMSHCGLPFEERNVEIYLHATIGEGQTREYADHYVYRYAETKAITIGKVTRLLKEVSVDCELNLGQTNFTVAKLSEIPENKEIRIHPSSKPANELMEFSVGDRAGTEACDYADNCEYTCSIKNASGLEVNKNPVAETYGIEHMRANSDRLIDALKNLFRKKDARMSYHTKEIETMMTPYTQNEKQLMLALTQIVDNQYEKVFDKYGREGRMINRGAFYAFQPIEVTDKRASLLENAAPVNFKHEKLNYPVSAEIVGSPMSPLSPMSPMSPKPGTMNDLWIVAIEELKKNMENVRRPEPFPVMASEDNWAINLNSITNTPRLAGADKEKRRPLIDFFLIEEHGFSKAQIEKYAMDHFLDTMNHRLKKSLIENLDNLNAGDPVERAVQGYFAARRFVGTTTAGGGTTTAGGSVGYIFTKVSKNLVKNVVLYRETPETNWPHQSAPLAPWTEEEPGEMLDFKRDMQDRLMKDLTRLNGTFGFVGYFTGRGIKEKGSAEGTMEYMTKTLGRGRGNKGAKLQGAGKDVIIVKYNSLMDVIGRPEKHYVEKEIKDISKNGFAIVLEMIMRKFQDEGKQDLIWHLTPEEAIANGINEYDI
jgi:hypothetical protein